MQFDRCFVLQEFVRLTPACCVVDNAFLAANLRFSPPRLAVKFFSCLFSLNTCGVCVYIAWFFAPHE
jgi:hypothetical protein